MSGCNGGSGEVDLLRKSGQRGERVEFIKNGKSK